MYNTYPYLLLNSALNVKRVGGLLLNIHMAIAPLAILLTDRIVL